MHTRAAEKSEAALLFNNLSDNLWALEDTDS
ncbi:hypothetical protein BANRA_02501 [Escherichia coli]|nr:hypothetical protein BANRA_02501 [Escherichia coli]